MNIKILLPSLLFVLSAAVTAVATPADWNAGRDLVANEKPDGTAQETSNPNGTVPEWSYGYREGVTGTTLSLFTPGVHNNALGGVAGEEGYEGASTAVGANTTDHDIVYTYCCGPLYPIAPGEMALGVNAANRSAVVRWTAPASGNYTYHADWRDIDPNGGDGAAGYVVVNGEQTFGQSWANGNNNGAATTAVVTLAAGDTIDFLLNPNGDISFDTTRVTFTVVSGGTPPPPPVCVTPPSGLVAQYSAENDAKDSVGTNHGTLQNATTFVPGKVGQAFQFGENNYLSIPDAVSLHPSSLTVEGWINLDVIEPGHAQSIFTKAVGGSGNDSIAVWYQSGALHGATTDAANAYVILDYPWQPALGTWHHVAYTFDGTSHSLYLDGLRVATGANTHVPAYDSHAALIGADYYSDANSSIIDFFLGRIDELSLYSRALTADEVQSIFSAGTQGKCKPPVPPAHGGLSATHFLVNESETVSGNLNDSVLRFRAAQTGHPAGLSMKVQSSTDQITWTDLPDNAMGAMSYAPQVTGYILNTTSYPTVNGVYFRALATADGYDDSPSNAVGPFDLSSSTPHVGAPLLLLTTNGENNALRFGVKQNALVSGLGVKIQTSQTPVDEASWVDAPIGNPAGAMTQDTTTPDLHQFYLGTDEYPEGDGIYFRAVTTAPGYVKGLSFSYGPVKVVHDPAATVTITINGVAFADGNTIDESTLLPTGSFDLQANASSGRLIKRLTLLYDGVVLKEFNDGATSGSINDYRTNIPGDHLVEAYATDDLGVTGAAPPVHVRVLPAAPGKIYQMTQSGNWNKPENWISIQGEQGIPGANDLAILGSFSPTLTTPVTVNAVSLNGGTITGAKLTVTSFGTIAAGILKNNLTIPSGSTLEFINDADVGLSGTLEYAGTVRLHGKGGITGVRNGSAASLALNASANPDGIFDGIVGFLNGIGNFFVHPPSGGRKGSKSAPPPAPNPPPKPEIRTVLAKVSISGGTFKPVSVPLISQDGTGIVSHDGGGAVSKALADLVAAGAGNLAAQHPAGIVSHDGGGIVSHDGGGIVSHDGGGFATKGGNLIAAGAGNLVAAGAGNLVAAGAGNIAPGAKNRPAPGKSGVAAPSDSAGLVLSGGEIDLSGIVVNGSVQIDGGILSGSGFIFGDLTNDGGYVSPGHSAGGIAVSGSFAQGPGGTLILENGGVYPDQFDQLSADSVSLGGKLVVHTINGYTPDPADTFNAIAYRSVSGNFASVSANTGINLASTGALLTTNPAIASPIDAALRNISTRARIGTGADVLIGGFIVTGPSGSTKKVMVRGLGPSLAAAGLTGLLSDPLLELHKPDGTTVTNDNWADLANKNEIPTGFAPQAKESVVIADLAPGNYTVIERGAHGETGVGLAEIYDLNESSLAHLGNIATRAFVDVTDNVLIGGFIVGGTEPGSILVRAVGPSLTAAGVPNALADPILELHDANGSVFLNDDWRETQENEIIATTIPPNDSREPAIMATLVPGNYTVIVRGKDSTTGVGLVEAYNVK